MSTELEQKALNRLLEGLRNLGCSYVVIDKDGADYTYGDALKKGQPKKGNKYGHYGALREYYGPWLKDLAPGDTVEIPAKDFDLVDIQSGVCSKAVTEWGPGSCITSMNRTKNVLEVLRVL
jgi:hypothetical protein